MPPWTGREHVLRGELQAYLVPTVIAVDSSLRRLRAELQTSTATRRLKVLIDIDRLLDRRRELQREAS